MYLFDKLCGLSPLFVFANLFFKKKKSTQANKGDTLNVYHLHEFVGNLSVIAFLKKQKVVFLRFFFK